MIYLVSNQQKLFDSPFYKMCSIKESKELLKDNKIIQFDTETTGREPHLCKLLSMQFGSMDGNIQIVVDCSTVNPIDYKDFIESHTILGQNLKFDLQFLFNYGIIPTRIYDTMIIEQLLYLGYPSGQIYYSLKAIAERRLDINLDKTVRGEIIWRGLDDKVIEYAALTYWGRIISNYYLEKWMNCWEAKGVILCQSAAKPRVHSGKVHRLPEQSSLLNNRSV